MLAFTFLFVYRVLSGAQNAAGYARRKSLRQWMTGALLALAVAALAVTLFQSGPLAFRLASGILMLASVAGIVGVEGGFARWQFLPGDIHLWESILTGAMVMAFPLAGWDVFGTLLSIYPALVLHKVLINLGGGNPWNYEGTDDATGETFTIPTLGISIPRATFGVRILIAIISIGSMIVAHRAGASLELY